MLVPLIVLAPVVIGGITLLLVSFMLALAAASLPVQLGKDWIWLHCARTAASTFPLMIALVAVHFDDSRDLWLVAACGIAALLAVAAALILLPRTNNRVADGAADGGRCVARAVRLARRRSSRRRIDGGCPGRGAAGDRAPRRQV